MRLNTEWSRCGTPACYHHPLVTASSQSTSLNSPSRPVPQGPAQTFSLNLPRPHFPSLPTEHIRGYFFPKQTSVSPETLSFERLLTFSLTAKLLFVFIRSITRSFSAIQCHNLRHISTRILDPTQRNRLPAAGRLRRRTTDLDSRKGLFCF